MKKILFLILFTITYNSNFSQTKKLDDYFKKAKTEKIYKLMKADMTINFYDVCKAAEIYLVDKDIDVKGSGWKGYMRWRRGNEYKYYPSGDRSNTDPFFTKNAYKQFIENNPSALGQPSNSGSRSASAGGTNYTGWKDLGPYSIDSITGHYSAGLGRIVAVYVDPSDTNIIYVGSRTGGFWKTINGGTSWTVTTDFQVATGVNTLDASPTNSDSVLINVNNARNHMSHGIYRSINGGNTWTQTNFNPTLLGKGGLGNYWQVYKVRYHPTIANLVFVAASDGLYRSTNNLSTWTKVYTGNIRQIEFHPTDPTILFIHNRNISNRVLNSHDAGLTFTQSNIIPSNNGNQNIRFSISDDCISCLYVASSNGIWKSTDTAKNFTLLGTSSESCLGFSVNDTDTSNMIYGYVDIDRSSDGGRTWSDATRWSLGNTNGNHSSHQASYKTSTNYVHADLQEAICVNGVFYVVTDGTISKSNDNGVSWKNIGQGLGIRMNYKLGASQSNHFRAICGSQDNGTSIKHKDNWVEFYGADGMESLIHPLNDDWMVGSVQFGSRIGTKDGGQTLSFYPRPSGESGSGNAYWEAPFAYNPNNQMTLYHFSAEIYKSDDFGTSWDSVSAPTSFTGTIERAAVAENNSNIIIISRGSAIDKSIDGGLSWTNIRGTLPGSSIQDIAFDPKNDDVIIVVYASYQNNGKKIYKTINGGTTWINITHNLGNLPIHTVVIDHQNASNIYIGAEIGVYTMPMNSTTWVLYNTNLPNNAIQELEVVYGSNSLKAAAWGRGLWEYTLVGRNSYPRIMTTKITDAPTELTPKETKNQFITSTISYSNAISSVFVRWSKDSAGFDSIIPMTNTADSTWVSNSPIPNYTAGTKIYFKVFSVGNSNDTSETYKFMYTVKEAKYCQSNGTMTYQGNITLVKFDSINKASGKDSVYTNYTLTDSATLVSGNTYNLTVNLNTDNGNYKYHASAWIDWNQDFVFDASERYDLGFSQNVTDGPTNSSPLSILVPSTAKQGKTRMRVASRYNSVITNPCATGTDGETEDYTLIIETVPLLAFTIDETNLCENETIHFSYTGDSVTSVTWIFTNGTDSLISSNKIDSLVVPNSGTYNLKLTGTLGTNNYILDSNVVFTVNRMNSDTFSLTSCSPTDTGTVVVNYTNVGGCDSLVTIFTHLIQGSTSTVNLTTCNPAQAGTVYDTLVNKVGCDSIVTKNRTLLASSTSTVNYTSCDPAQVGTLYDTLVNTVGCDSIVTKNTTLLASSSSSVNYTSCDPAQVGTLYDTLVNTVGCDSIVTKNTILLASSATTLNLKTCDPLLVGTKIDTLVNMLGCDSLVTKLTALNPSYNNTINLTSCDSTKIGTVVLTDTTTLGCDSITTTNTSIGTNSPSISVNGLVLTANPTGLSYQWLDCGNGYSVINGETNQTYTVTTNGNFAVEITDGYCVDTATCKSVMNVGVISNDFKERISLFPNPTNGRLKVELQGVHNNVKIKVTNELGQLIIKKQIRRNKFIVDLTKYETGVYFLTLESNEKNASFKIIKND